MMSLLDKVDQGSDGIVDVECGLHGSLSSSIHAFVLRKTVLSKSLSKSKNLFSLLYHTLVEADWHTLRIVGSSSLFEESQFCHQFYERRKTEQNEKHQLNDDLFGDTF